MDRVADYLRIPAGYAPFLDGLRWAASGEAVEYSDGRTFVLAPQLALFLEGLSLDGPAVPFAFVLHFLALLGLGKDTVRAAELARAFHETGRPMRNAGALAGVLCRGVPPVADPPDMALVCRRLGSPLLMAELAHRQSRSVHSSTDSVPPLTAAAFEEGLVRELAGFTPGDLRHWLRHGRGPVGDAGARLARALPPAAPPTLGRVLAELTRRPRLAGAVPFVAQLVSALALPPRRLAHPELPLGGYADVATRGRPEQILPSQLVLEDPPTVGEAAPARPGALSLEFVRRFAENELLYFRREEPHARVREELVLLLDQGVRTWGDVRLVLTAAVLALGRLAERRRLPLWLAGTSSGGRLLDPLRAEPEELARLVEASDLSSNPGLALERVLEERGAAGPDRPVADIVLLTHPRNLAEPDVAAAARRAGPGVRLFALTVDGHGAAELARLQHGTPVRLTRFRVDLARPASAPAAPALAGPRAPWCRDVEPVGFPFRFGVTPSAGRLRLFNFDQGGEWVLQIGENGVPHAWRADGSAAEVLPRGFVNGAVLTDGDDVLGVAGGFVVAGRLGGQLVAVHYDFPRRVCTAHVLGPVGDERWRWGYFADLHTVVAEGAARRPDRPTCAVDLATGAVTRHGQGPLRQAETRPATACWRALRGEFPSPWVYPRNRANPTFDPGPCLRFDRLTGTLTLVGTKPSWPPFVPLADGRPLLQGGSVVVAQSRGDVLTVVCQGPDEAGPVLRLFRGPRGTTLGELLQPRHETGYFLLSPDGRRLARAVSPSEVEVRDVGHGLRILGTSPRGRGQPGLAVELGDRWLVLQAGRSTHLIRWDRGAPECVFTIGDRERSVRQQLAGTPLRTTGVRATAEALPPFVLYDRKRFVAAAHGTLIAVVDVYGQVALFEKNGRLVAMFFVFRGQAAGWLPDGTCFGPASVIDGPAAPGAAERFGAALRDAWKRNEEARP